ncbi:ATP-binding cassette domain-containing protein, partial [bacterium]|nr:ATP-binding cassette domain-containing protein [bacterium]
MISVKHLTKYYGDKKVVDDISFNVKKGEILGFLGPNAAGKTTTMRIITCYLSASSGTVNVGGDDIFENPMEVKHRIGYMPENPPLYT